MPLTQQLLLDADPTAARVARRWVGDRLRELGRPELEESAQLGVSELVTNALLHAEPPVHLRLRGTVDHPRIEVLDTSTVTPQHPREDLEDAALATGGRGLEIVALFSRAWGSVVDADGKLMWFEPTAEEPEGGMLTGHHVVLDDLDDLLDEDETRIRIRLLGMPAREWADFRRMYTELRRELRLLAVAHPEDYPLAAELTALARRVEAQRRRATGLERLEDAIAEGADAVDLIYDVPAHAPQDMARLAELLVAATDFCREHRLLASAPTADHLALVRWYTGEFVRQAAGEAPRAYVTGA